ncbi:MAG: 50S ribosomal protein L11 methyltransferase, partial [Actinobacteria bacterium]|nr:50S ribosomal protein L11 methyltransferase [Actinomycetota bacterium]
MSSPSYIRFRLRLHAPGHGVSAAAEGDLGAAPAGDDRPAACGRDSCAAAVHLLAGLPLPGWQEEEDGDDRCLVFWLPAACVADASVEKAIGELRGLGDLTAAPESSGWETRWRDFHHPVRVGRILVRPPWATPDPELLEVVVDVGMAFGTGGHATTRQCLELLQHVRPGRLLDVGCGSGVLSIAALRLGYGPVEA